MLERLHNSKPATLVLALVFGVLFGFFLQKGGVTHYAVIVNQLLLVDFTVVKVMLSAVVVGMIGIYAMKGLGWVTLHPKPGSWAADVIGGLMFGAGFALLGYCPGTAVGAAGQGNMDALVGGVVGMATGAGIFAALYPALKKRVLDKGSFGALTLPALFKVNGWLVIVPVCVLIVLLLALIESAL